MNLAPLAKKIDDIYERQTGKTRIIFEDDTSLTVEYGKGFTWNLPHSFLDFRWYQQDVHNAVFRDKKRFVYLAWCRRLGKEVTTWSLLIKYCMLRRCTGVMIYPDNKMATRILWEGKMSTKEGTVDFLDFLPPLIDRDKDINQTVKRIDFPNGSQIWLLGAENYDKLRGINPHIAVFSEYDFQTPMAYQAIRPIMAENGGTIVVQTTFNGISHGIKLWDNVKDDEDWHTSFFTAETAKDENGVRYIPAEEIEKMRRENIPEHFIQQEYFMNAVGDVNKYCFADTLEKMRSIDAFQSNLWTPGYSVYSFWDIGVDDDNCIILAQFINNQPRIVAYFKTNGKTYEYEVEQVTKWRTARNLSLGKHFVPHDGKNRTKTVAGEMAMNGQEYISQKLGEPCEAVERPRSLAYGLQLVRSLLPKCLIDEKECDYVIECLSQHRKVWDETRQVYKLEGVHDWTSHMVKAIQTMAIAMEKGLVATKPLQHAQHYIRRENGLQVL